MPSNFIKSVNVFNKNNTVSKLYMDSIKTPWGNWAKKFIVLTFSAFIFYLAISWFVAPAGLIIGGIGGIATIFSYVVSGLSNLDANWRVTLYFIINFGLNIPLIIFGAIKVGKKFTLMTTYVMVIQVFISLAFQHFYPDFINSDPLRLSKESNIATVLFGGIIGGILIGLACIMAYSVNASGGGLDFIYIYLSIYKKQTIGSLSLIVNFVIVTLGILLLQTEPHKFLPTQDPNTMNLAYFYRIFGAQLIGTLFYIFSSSLFIDWTFPKQKKVEMQIFTKDPEKIYELFKSHNYRFTWTEISGKGGYTNSHIKIVSTMTTFYEYKQWVPLIKQIEPNVFITIKPIIKIQGQFIPFKFN